MPRGNRFVPNCLNWFSKFKHHAQKTLSEFAVNALQRTSHYFALSEYSEATKHLYLTELRYLFSHYGDLRPSLLTQQLAEDYLLYLATTLKCSKTKTKMASQSISFFFKFVLKREYDAPRIFNTAHCSKLPAVMSVDEVRNIILSVKNLKHRTLLSLVYSTGMRLQELCNLKIEHIDSKLMVIKVGTGKGKVIEHLRRYTNKVAISNYRFISNDAQAGMVSFRYKDYADNNAEKIKPLQGTEFVRRFEQHIPPKGFNKIRSYGYLSKRGTEVRMAQITKAMNVQNGILCQYLEQWNEYDLCCLNPCYNGWASRPR